MRGRRRNGSIYRRWTGDRRRAWANLEDYRDVGGRREPLVPSGRRRQRCRIRRVWRSRSAATCSPQFTDRTPIDWRPAAFVATIFAQCSTLFGFDAITRHVEARNRAPRPFGWIAPSTTGFVKVRKGKWDFGALH